MDQVLLDALKWGVLSVISILGFLMKRTINEQDSKIKHLESETANIKEKYLHKDDFKDFKVELRSMFDELKQDIRAIKHNG